MKSLTRFGALAVTAVALASAGCSSTSTCSRDADDLVVAATDGQQINNAWYSAPPIVGPYQHFPPARTVHFMHGLGAVPLYQINVAFSDHGQFALATGNEAVVTCIDDREVDVLNDTCADFYIDFSAWRAPPDPSSGGEAGDTSTAGVALPRCSASN